MPRRYGEAPVASATVNPYSTRMGFPGSTSGKRICLAEQETHKTRVRSLDLEGPLEKEVATHSSIFV